MMQHYFYSPFSDKEIEAEESQIILTKAVTWEGQRMGENQSVMKDIGSGSQTDLDSNLESTI